VRPNLLCKLTILVFAFIFSVGNVEARWDKNGKWDKEGPSTHNYSTTISRVENGRTVLLCDYYHSKDETGKKTTGVGGKIYYQFQEVNSNYPGLWDIYYYNEELGEDPSWLDYQLHGQEYKNLVDGNGSDSYGPTKNVFIDSKRIHNELYGNYFNSKIDETFTCKKNMFIDYGGSAFVKNKLCFGNNSSCGDKFKEGPYSLVENNTTIFSVIDSYIVDSLNEVNFKDLKFDYVKKTFDSKQVGDLVKEKIMSKINGKYEFGTKYIMPKFIENYISKNIDIPDEKLEAWKTKVDNQITKEEEEGNITSEEAEFYREEVGGLTVDKIIDVPSSIIDLDISDELSCDGLLGTDMSALVKKGFDYIKFGGPILVAIFTIVDFLKSALSGEADDVKKSANKFVKRAIAGVLLFFIPIICNMLFDFAGITVPDMCIANGTESQTQETIETDDED